MKYLLVKDKIRRLEYKKNELKFLSFKTFLHENFVKANVWVKSFKKGINPNFIGFLKNRESFFFFRNKGGIFIKLKNRCVITGRSKSVNRRYRVSRITLRELASNGKIVGLKKVSW